MKSRRSPRSHTLTRHTRRGNTSPHWSRGRWAPLRSEHPPENPKDPAEAETLPEADLGIRALAVLPLEAARMRPTLDALGPDHPLNATPGLPRLTEAGLRHAPVIELFIHGHSVLTGRSPGREWAVLAARLALFNGLMDLALDREVGLPDRVLRRLVEGLVDGDPQGGSAESVALAGAFRAARSAFDRGLEITRRPGPHTARPDRDRISREVGELWGARLVALPLELARIVTGTTGRRARSLDHWLESLIPAVTLTAQIRAFERADRQGDPLDLARGPCPALVATAQERLGSARRALLDRCLFESGSGPLHDLTARRLVIESGAIEATRNRARTLTRTAFTAYKEMGASPSNARALLETLKHVVIHRVPTGDEPEPTVPARRAVSGR